MNKYGNYYWYVELTNGDNLHLVADNATVCADGSLVFDTVQESKVGRAIRLSLTEA